jgi:hypothetical protein
MSSAATHDKAATAAASRAWSSTELLLALAKLVPKVGQRITSAELAAAVPHLRAEQRMRATTRLGTMGFLVHKVVLVKGESVHTFTVTDDGLAAIEAAQSGWRITSGKRGPRAPRPGSVAARVWALLRIRKVLDADSAAQLLCNAEDGNYRNVRETARIAMARWAADGVLSISHQPIVTGFGGPPRKRYVLVKDPGPMPPAWQPRKGAGQ